MSEFWRRYSPRFNLLTDAGPDGLFVLDAGLYREVRFNHRAMRAFWLAAYIAWEGYERIHELVTTDAADFGRFDEMVKVFFRLLEEDDPRSVKLPLRCRNQAVIRLRLRMHPAELRLSWRPLQPAGHCFTRFGTFSINKREPVKD